MKVQPCGGSVSTSCIWLSSCELLTFPRMCQYVVARVSRLSRRSQACKSRPVVDQIVLSLHQRHPKICTLFFPLATTRNLLLKQRGPPEYLLYHAQHSKPRKIHLSHADCENHLGQSFAEILHRRPISDYLAQRPRLRPCLTVVRYFAKCRS